MFYIQLQDRDFNEVHIPAGLNVSVVSYSKSSIGGATSADLIIAGEEEALASVLNWLRYGVVIKNGNGTTVWSGIVNEVEVDSSTLFDRVTLDNMYNEVAVTYSYSSASGGSERATTTTLVDSESVDRYGSKQLIFSAGEYEFELAEAKRDEIIRQNSLPAATPIVSFNTDSNAKVYCTGLFSTLGWKYFERLEGKIENEGVGTEISFPVGWKVSSAQVNFLGTSTSYTRSVTSCTNATPIVVGTSIEHGLSSGDIVTISGVLGNTNANGTFKVASATSSQFELTDSVSGDDIAGSGTYTGGGTVTATIENTTDSRIAYGKKVTGATNATPIVITCASHGLSNGDLVRISDIEGNRAASGEFIVANKTINTFELTNKVTGSDIPGTGYYATGGIVLASSAAGMFGGMIAGRTLTITGSTSNNGTFLTTSDGNNEGRNVDIYPVPTTEFAGATTVIQLTGEKIAQSFLGEDNFGAYVMALKLGVVGTVSDNLTIQLKNDSGGSVGSTVLASATITGSELSTSAEWVWVTLDSIVQLTAGTRYWIVIGRSGSTSSINHYVVKVDNSTYETMNLWNGSVWTSGDAGYSIPFKVHAVEDVMDQIIRVVEDCGQFISYIDSDGDHGIASNPYRAGDRLGLDEIVDLLYTSGVGGKRLLCEVDENRSLKIYTEPDETDSDDIIVKGMVQSAGGQLWEEGVLPVGKWLTRGGIPSGVDIMIQRSVFMEEATYDVSSGKISQFRLRGSQGFF